MKLNLILKALALAAVLPLSACTTVVDDRPPVTTSTTTTEETTSVHPMRGAATTQTTVTQTH